MCVGLSPMHKVCAITIKYTLCITSTVPAHNTCFTLCIASVLLWSVHDVSMYNVEWYIDDVCMSLFVIVLVTRDHLCILLSLLGRIQLTLVLPRSPSPVSRWPFQRWTCPSNPTNWHVLLRRPKWLLQSMPWHRWDLLLMVRYAVGGWVGVGVGVGVKVVRQVCLQCTWYSAQHHKLPSLTAAVCQCSIAP